MFDHKHYVPILKGRDGEYRALRALVPDVRDALTPLLEVPPIPWDYEQQKPTKTIDAHLRKVGQKIERAWGTGRDLYIDLLWISEAEKMSGGEHPLSSVFQSLREREVNAIPVTGLLRGQDYVDACRDIIGEDGRGVCIRVQREDFVEFDNIESTLRQILDHLTVKVRDADLVLDLRALTPAERCVDASAVIGLVTQLPSITEWRTFTVAATSFPPNLIGLPPSDFSLIPRDEWELWAAICRHRPTLRRVPTFGDYAISHPEPAEVDPRVM